MPSATIKILVALQRERKIDSDKLLAETLRVTAQTICNYRSGRSQMSDEVAYRAARLLGRHPGPLMARIHFERATDPDLKAVWKGIAKDAARLLEPLLVDDGDDDEPSPSEPTRTASVTPLFPRRRK